LSAAALFTKKVLHALVNMLILQTIH